MKSIVYFTKRIDSKALIDIYNRLNANLKGRVGVKVSTGEAGNNNFLNPFMIEPLVSKLNGTIIECNTAYRSKRACTEDHKKVIEDHNWNKIAKVDIMDEEGSIEIPVKVSTHLKNKNIVGSHIQNYDSILMLNHFKGHAMGGFGGALKNMAIGMASSTGKLWIHSAGKTTNKQECWTNLPPQDDFLESMAEACEGIIDYFGHDNIVYISVANNLSVDCDCDSNPDPVKMKDIGIFASLDPVALDTCCYNTIINSNDEGRFDLIERMNSRHGIHTCEKASELGLGNMEYELIDIDK